MLILTRRIGEAIWIADEIEIKVLGIHGQQVRIGINAPKQLKVYREEVYWRIQRKKQFNT